MPYAPTKLIGRERLTGADVSDATMLDFWQWAFSDLRANSLRGVLSEWIVAKLLGLAPIAPPVRDPWGEYDLRTPEGVTLEVKASAYLQSWMETGASKIVFSGLRGQTWTPATGYSGKATYNAQLYVFCVQTEKDPARWDALDLGQWRFYLATRDQLAALDISGISLPTLQTLGKELTATELPHEAWRIIQELARA
jgi:hypothetical protein